MTTPRTCACCPRPAWEDGTRSRFCWHPACPCQAWCDCCERAPHLPGHPLCGPCALRCAREPRRRVVIPPPAARSLPRPAGGIEPKGRRFRAVVRGPRAMPRTVLGYFGTEAEAEAAILAFRATRRAA